MSHRTTDRLATPASEEPTRSRERAPAILKMMVLAVIALPILAVLVFVAASLIGQRDSHQEYDRVARVLHPGVAWPEALIAIDRATGGGRLDAHCAEGAPLGFRSYTVRWREGSETYRDSDSWRVALRAHAASRQCRRFQIFLGSRTGTLSLFVRPDGTLGRVGPLQPWSK
jgi:hypothetical protein